MEQDNEGQGAADEVTGQMDPVPPAPFTEPDPTWQWAPQQSVTPGGPTEAPPAPHASPFAPPVAPPTGPPAQHVFDHGMATGSPTFADPRAPGYSGAAGSTGLPGPYGAASQHPPYWRPAHGAGAGWYPPPPPPPGGTAWLGAGQADPAQPAGAGGSRARRRAVRGGVAILVVGVTMAAGIGVGHVIWQPTSSTSNQSAVSSGGNGSSSTTTPGNGSGGSTIPSGGGSTGTTTPGGSTGGTGNRNPFGGGFPFGGGQNPSGSTGGSSSSAPGSPSNISSIAAKVDPALVDINTVIDYGSGEAAGTGIVLTPSGEILTNNHVIDGATTISVTDVGNGHTYKATVVGYNRTSDIAVLQLQGASGLQAAGIGDSSQLTVGQSVVALGNAGGAGGTPSVAGGSITSLNRSITASDEGGNNSEQLHGLIEINADIQPGDSGGSLVDSSGKVIGIDTAASSGLAFQSASTDGYAIPINAATQIATQIVSGQKSSTVHIGASGFLGVKLGTSFNSATGFPIADVVSGTPAANAGLTGGDIITAVNGQAISSPSELTTIMTQHYPGDQLTLTYTDSSGNQHTATLTLTSGPAA